MEKFFKYFDDRYRAETIKDSAYQYGPVITISRQTGCDALAIAKKLVIYLNGKQSVSKWKWVDKEILLDAARKLNTDAYNVESSINRDHLSGLSEMIMAVSGRHISDKRVKKTIRDVVLSICREGHVVLVGRGGVSLTGGIRNALHVRLMAPFYWRVENIIQKRRLDIGAAEEFVVDTDEKRYKMIISFLDRKPLNLDYLFDVVLNRSSFSVDQIAHTLYLLYGKRMDYLREKGFAAGRGSLNDAYG